MSWHTFLTQQAVEHRLSPDQTDVFLERFNEANKDKSEAEIESLIEKRLGVKPEAYKQRRKGLYDKFAYSCRGLENAGSHKAERLRKWLESMYSQQSPEPEPDSSINWREVCNQVLAKQPLRGKATEWGFELNVYVPLGLVERKQQQRRGGDVACEQVYQLDKEVITKEYQHDDFLEEVIGKSDNSKGKHIAIIGEPGAGKTTRLGKIASWIQENEKGLPICIPLAGLEGKTIEEYLCQKWLKEALPYIDSQAVLVTSAMEDELIKLFQQGKVWLLLDGVDELGASSPVAALATIKKQVTDWVASARVVLTCRLNVWDASVNNTLTDFDTYRTLEFEQQQVSEFIQQWFACAGKPDVATQLLTKLNEPIRERIRGLVKNPLRLALLCQTWYLQPDDLPKTKAELYQRFTRYFYEWKQEQHYICVAEQKELNAAL
ncbi:MAG TPA: NACHT domain-containing protein, partial [Candidatus Obscuribacterales bacterium]